MRARLRPLIGIIAGLAMLFGDATAVERASQGSSSTRVLLLFDEDRSLPGLALLEQSLRATISAGLDRVEFYSESLSFSQFGDADYESVVTRYFRDKFAGRQPQVIVAVMGPALQYLLRHGDELFPGVPIVSCGADEEDFSRQVLPKNVTGLLVRRTFAPTLDVALRLHPGTAHVYVVGGTSPFDSHLLVTARRELQRFAARVQLEYLTDLSMPQLLGRVRALPRNSLVLYLSMFRDAAGNAYVPHDAVRELAAAANAPVYVFVDQFVGLGPVGGVVYSVSSHGTRAAEIALRVVHGESPSAIPVQGFEGSVPLFDERQLVRWGIDAAALPAGADVRWREPSLWRDYRSAVMAAGSVGAVLAGLVVGLLYERRARRRAELRTREQLTITSHLGRQLAMGEMATALAHELNQPLGTIRLNVAAAERLLNAGPEAAGEMRAILHDIEREDARASEIIQRQRAMLQKRDPELRRLNLNDVVRESAAVVAHEAISRRVRLDLALSETRCVVKGDQILLQQVIVNLLINAMDAMTAVPEADRRVVVATAASRHVATVSVRDRGEGIADSLIARVFEPFVTTKEKGLGIGLTIARGIIEAHHGTIHAVNHADGGATFSFTLPADVPDQP